MKVSDSKTNLITPEAAGKASQIPWAKGFAPDGTPGHEIDGHVETSVRATPVPHHFKFNSYAFSVFIRLSLHQGRKCLRSWRSSLPKATLAFYVIVCTCLTIFLALMVVGTARFGEDWFRDIVLGNNRTTPRLQGTTTTTSTTPAGRPITSSVSRPPR
jgi:hypothetical protein